MNQTIKTGIMYGIAGGLLTFIFGGWSVAVIGVIMGVGLGLILGGRINRGKPMAMALEILPAALAAGMVLVLLSLLQNYKIYPSIGKPPYDINTVIGGNLAGFVGVVLFTCLMTAFRGLPPQQERLAKLIVLGILVVAFPFFDQFSQ